MLLCNFVSSLNPSTFSFIICDFTSITMCEIPYIYDFDLILCALLSSCPISV